MHGKQCRHPFTNRLLPIITDTMVDMELGTGDGHNTLAILHKNIWKSLTACLQLSLFFALISYSCLCYAGAVKVTPAHDHTDFLLSQRHSLPRVTVIGGNGTMTGFCGDWLEVHKHHCHFCTI